MDIVVCFVMSISMLWMIWASFYRLTIFGSKILSVMVLQRFSFSIDPAEAQRITYSITLTMNICNSKDAELKDRTYELLLRPRPRKW